MHLGDDALAQVADAHVQLDRCLGLLQVLVEQDERTARRSERLTPTALIRSRGKADLRAPAPRTRINNRTRWTGTISRYPLIYILLGPRIRRVRQSYTKEGGCGR